MSNRFISALRLMGPRLIVQAAVMFAILIGAGYLLQQYQFPQIVEWFRFSSDENAGLLHGRIAYFMLCALFTAAGGPRQAVAFFAAYFFGIAEGFFLALFATLAGCLITVAAATGFRDAARNFVVGKLDVALQMWSKSTFSITLMIRLLPVGSNLVTNLAAGATGIPLLRFIAGTATGYLPQTLVFALMGSGVNVGSRLQIGLSVVLFVASLAIGIWIYARYRREIKMSQRTAKAATTA